MLIHWFFYWFWTKRIFENSGWGNENFKRFDLWASLVRTHSLFIENHPFPITFSLKCTYCVSVCVCVCGHNELTHSSSLTFTIDLNIPFSMPWADRTQWIPILVHLFIILSFSSSPLFGSIIPLHLVLCMLTERHNNRDGRSGHIHWINAYAHPRKEILCFQLFFTIIYSDFGFCHRNSL